MSTRVRLLESATDLFSRQGFGATGIKAVLAAAEAPGALPAEVQRVQDIGTHLTLTAQVGGQLLKARLAPDTTAPAAGSTVWLQVLNPHTCFYLDEELVAE